VTQNVKRFLVKQENIKITTQQSIHNEFVCPGFINYMWKWRHHK